MAEEYRKRSYRVYFQFKFSNSDMENTEAQARLNFALSRRYISDQPLQELDQEILEIEN